MFCPELRLSRPCVSSRPRVSRLFASLGAVCAWMVCLGIGGLAGQMSCDAQTPLGLGVLHNFLPLGSQNSTPGGAMPLGAVASGGDGFLYGVASGGVNGQGAVFQVRPDGTGFHSLYEFSPLPANAPPVNAEGAMPQGTLLPGSGGVLYGTARMGGANGTGTLFQVSVAHGNTEPFYTFTALDSSDHNADGAAPGGGLTAGSSGFFYGTATRGGVTGDGTVFQIKSDGSVFTTLHSFAFATDGSAPNGALAAPGDGYLYGTTLFGGTNSVGTVFRVKTDGTGFLVLHTFSVLDGSSHNADGADPSAGLTPGPGGYLYSTTQFGGTNGTGTIFRLKTDGSGFQVIHSFSEVDANGRNVDGASPSDSSVTLGPDGLLYGTAEQGGASSTGTVFRLVSDGTGFQTVFTFSAPSGSDPYGRSGGAPVGTPVFGKDGFVYGPTLAGGLSGGGLLYRLASAHTHLLWDTTDGRASVVTVDALGSATYSPAYGPFPGWKATALATGPDGVTHLLWNNANGQASLWSLTASGQASYSPNYGPYSGWGASALTVGSDGLPRLLWDNTSGQAALWNVSATGSFTAGYFGPYSGWSAIGTASTSGGVSHLLWRSTTGQSALWTVDSLGQLAISPNYGPFPGWQTTGLGTGLQGERELLWTHPADGLAALWRVESSGQAVSSPNYGPYSGYTCVAVTADPVGLPHLLWSHSADGRASLWTLDGAGDVPGGGTSTLINLGPYSDGHGGYWSPVALSAGP